MKVPIWRDRPLKLPLSKGRGTEQRGIHDVSVNASTDIPLTATARGLLGETNELPIRRVGGLERYGEHRSGGAVGACVGAVDLDAESPPDAPSRTPANDEIGV